MLSNKHDGEVHKTLLLHHVLMAQFREKYRYADSVSKKHSIAATLSGKMIQKYRLLNLLHKNVGMAQRVARKKL